MFTEHRASNFVRLWRLRLRQQLRVASATFVQRSCFRAAELLSLILNHMKPQVTKFLQALLRALLALLGGMAGGAMV